MQYSLHRRTRGFMLAGALFLAGTPLLHAMAAQAPEAEPITLAFKYPAGRVQKFRLSATGDLMFTPEGGGAALGGLPITTSMQFQLSEKVLENKENAGTLTVKLDSMQMDLDILGTKTSLKSANGKTTGTMNGQPLPPDHPLVAVNNQMSATPPLTIRRDLRGQPLEEAGASEAASFLGGGAITAFLPDHPVKIGDSWSAVQKVVNSVPGSPVGGGPATVTEVKFNHTLRELQVRDGHRHAIIESTSEGTPDAGMEGNRQNINGVTRFDVDRGMVVSSAYSMELATSLPGSALGGNGPQTIRIEGTIKYNLSEVPDAAPASASKTAVKQPAPKQAAAKKPAAKKR